jgi:hypothetical protein
MFTNMLRKRMESQVPARGSGGVQKQKILHRQLAHAHPQEAGKANKTVYAFFLDVRKAYDTVWRDGLSAKLLEEGVDGKLWRVLRDLAIKSTSQVRVNGDLSEAFPLSAGVGQGDPYLRCCSISLSMTSWLDCMIRALSMASAWGR